MTYLYNIRDELVVRIGQDKKYFYWDHRAWLRSHNDYPLAPEHLIPDSAVLLVGAPLE